MPISEIELKHNKVLSETAAECTVLLKKDGNFPLNKPCKIALFGNGARRTIKGGTGSGGVNSRNSISVEEGLENAGFIVTSKLWLDAFDNLKEIWHKSFIEDIKKKAADEGVSVFVAGFGAIDIDHDYDLPIDYDAEAAVYVLSRISGEGSDRKFIKGDILLTDTEVKDILNLSKKFEKFMLVLNVGGVVDLTPVLNVQNILLLSQLGGVSGKIFANIILGISNPSGKLTTTWAKNEDYCQLGEFGELNDTRYKEGVYVGYRYFDTIYKNPLFSFGFGLSFTDFKIEFKSVKHIKSTITVLVDVSNIGKYNGKEVVQLYVSCPNGRIDKPLNALVAFGKTKELKPNEKQELELEFSLEAVASFDMENAQYILEKGNYALKLGNSSNNINICAAINLNKDVIIKKVKSFSSLPDFFDAAFKVKKENCFGLKTLYLTEKDFDTEIINYSKSQSINEFLKSLSNEQLCHLCIGAYTEGNGSLILGNSSLRVCGAAGETTNKLKDILGEKAIVMADGPAGLRLTNQYIKTEEGLVPAIKELPDGLGELLDPAINESLKAKYEKIPKEMIIEQYTTSIPIATAIGQSWNAEIAKLFGDIVGTEMENFGINLWLAPALNIQRDIRCGRNFEYYSEDPFLSGKIAGAVIKGVQKHKNCGVTIKHFAANNQEYNRYNNNSIISERALREIYLRGFEICIKESNPKTLMTSYNLLNGIHTSENKQLLYEILRCEFNFNGVVMSDWITSGMLLNKKSKHPSAFTSNLVKAGNDLTMAGSKTDFDDLISAVNLGKVSRKDLLICASRVFNLIEDLSSR